MYTFIQFAGILMKHKFCLIPSHHPYAEYIYAKNRSIDIVIEIDDDVLWYIKDFLDWIPTVNPAKKEYERAYGLNFYGPTIIEAQGAVMAKRVFGGLKSLFSIGPSVINLRGLPYFDAEEDYSHEKLPRIVFSTLQYERQVLVEVFRKLETFADQIGSGAYYMVHFGI